MLELAPKYDYLPREKHDKWTIFVPSYLYLQGKSKES